MGRVEWSRCGGDEVEAVVAMLVNREYVESVRITPSRGDGGVDILHRNGAGPGNDVVYQVKKFSSALNAGQKRQIENSLHSLVEDPRWSDLNVTQWNLVLPVDPTPETELWFQSVIDDYPFQGLWKGLAYLDQLAARYPDVIDYYLHGGRERLVKQQKELFKLNVIDREVNGRDVESAVRKIQMAVDAMQQDPFYSYELHIGEGDVADIGATRKGRVLSTVTVDQSVPGGKWSIIDVIARCASSVEASPIMVSGEIKAKKGSVEAVELKDFHEYGLPPKRVSFSGMIEAPGGLGGNLDDGKFMMSSRNVEEGYSSELRMEFLDQNDNLLADVDVDRVWFSSGARGIAAIYREVQGIFEIVLKCDYTDIDRKTISGSMTMTTTVRWSIEDIADLPVSKVFRAFKFLDCLNKGNRGFIGNRHYWNQSKLSAPFLSQGFSESQSNAVSQIIATIDDLSVIQQHADGVISVPSIDKVSSEELAKWSIIARYLRGESPQMRYSEDKVIWVQVDSGVEVAEKCVLVINQSLSINIGGSTFNLGEMAIEVIEPRVIERKVMIDHDYLMLDNPDRTYRLLPRLID